MQIPDGYHDLPPGKIASIVTYLEMHTPPASLDAAPPNGVTVRRVENPDLAWFREIFRAVGEKWLWFSRVIMPDEELRALLNHPSVDLFVLDYNGESKGILEIDRREYPDIELSFFGLTTDMIGRGAGRYLIQYAIRETFLHKPRRFFLHTCTLDSPQALGFYRKAGFVPYKLAVEVAPDPRLNGTMPPDAAPQIPIISG
jgi:ribosomal protein S18 acetylase RimI-like enzyme